MSEQDQKNVQLALDLTQRAQAIFDEAATALCSVPGFAKEWNAATDVLNAIKKWWYDVENRRAQQQRGSKA